MKYNAHKLFYQRSEQPCLRRALILTDAERLELQECQKKIRRALRAELSAAAAAAPKEHYFNKKFLEAASVAINDNFVLRPRFKTQGSWAYDTLNRPAKPGQEIDLDDGMYVPMSSVKGVGPAIASSTLFFAVETVLSKLCDVEGWELDTSKSICVRVVISDRAHIDVNIYAIPDLKMVLLEKSVTASRGVALDSDFDLTAANRRRELRLDPDEIYVAHRDDSWEQSDPLELEDWFLDAVKVHSEWTDLKRIVRYLKAWRDHRWQSCRLSSIALMACAVEALEVANTPPIKNRDDDGLLVVARALGGYIARGIDNPVIKGKSLSAHWSVGERNEFELAARLLHSELEASLRDEPNTLGVVARLRKLFGVRMPDDHTLVELLPLISQVRNTPAQQSPSPKVGSATSG